MDEWLLSVHYSSARACNAPYCTYTRIGAMLEVPL